MNPAQWHSQPDNHQEWQSIQVTNQILGGFTNPLELDVIKPCAKRVARLVTELRGGFVGLNKPRLGYVTDWLIATLVARENALMIGPPGVAKSEIAISLLKLAGLEPPLRDPNDHTFLEEINQAIAANNVNFWLRQLSQNDGKHRYFHYLLSRFTQPEELFGPVEINLLRLGILARVNLGLMTGPGMRAAFLDEIFKASSSILNTLLTLTNERMFFNWGGMVRSDLVFTIGASNEMPGGFATGAYGIGSGGEDFQTLYAFVDRFPSRLHIETVRETNLREATEKSLSREAVRFTSGQDLAEAVFAHVPRQELPVINDLLLLGRAMMQHRVNQMPMFLFDETKLTDFKSAFYSIAASLQQDSTSLESGQIITWTINPRKLRAIYKIALAHALLRWCMQGEYGARVMMAVDDLYVFKLIWDAQSERVRLEQLVDELLAHNKL